MTMKPPLTLPLIPLPSDLKEGEGHLALATEVTAVVDRGCEFEGRELGKVLREVGVHVHFESRVTRGTGIAVRLGGEESIYGPEGYRLDVEPAGIRLVAHAKAGAFYGIQTLRQILMSRGKAPLEVPEVHIFDKPRFAWRGMLLDVSRHFYPAEEIKRNLDYLAELKMNVFHWHLTDDGGWRMEVKKYPKLTEKGAWRTDVPGVIWGLEVLEFPGKESGKKLYGGFYTQEQIRDIVAYAAERNITIVPEIEMPGHALAAMESYPELGCDIQKGPGEAYKTNVYCAGKEETMKFVQDVLDETMALFPSKIIHIGGDEVDKGYWSRCPKCNEYIRLHGLKDYNELQSSFIRRAEEYLNSKGRTLIGWDEILEGGLAPNATVMSWRGISGGIAAAKSGHDVVMSPTSHCYFDYGYDGTSTEHVYDFEPIPADLTPGEAARVKGAQANVWTEWIPNFHRVEYMIFPRILAMAEVLWTPKSKAYFPYFKRRLEPHYREFIRRGIDFYVGRPSFEANLRVFKDSCQVSLEEPSLPGVILRYSTDGKDPSVGYPRMTGPVTVVKNQVISAAYMRGDKIMEGVTRVTCVKNPPKVDVKPGIAYSLTDAKYARMPDWSKEKIVRTGGADAFDIAPFVQMDTFGLRWTAYIHIEKEGMYAFTMGSDDGSILKILDAVVVDNDGPHPYAEKTGRAYLLPGDYPIEIGYFEAGGAEQFEVFVEGPGLSKRKLEELVVK